MTDPRGATYATCAAELDRAESVRALDDVPPLQERLRASRGPAMSGESHQEPWWSINGEVLLDALRRANRGEDADLLYAELYANTESQEDSHE